MSSPANEIDRLLRLCTDQAKIRGVLRVEAHDAEGIITRESVRAFLTERKVVESFILSDELAALVEEVQADHSVPHERQVVQGQEPSHGVNARVEFSDEIATQFESIAQRHAAFTLAQEANAFDEEPSAKAYSIDFYNESTVIVVSAGEVIASLQPSTPGEDGYNIFGANIASKTGKDLEGVIDESCVIDANNRIISQIDGHLTYQGQKIRIHPALEIVGNVDFSTGNIEFPRDVVIQKGVRDRFKVSTKGNLEIHKLVEAAHLSSQQNIVLLQGMAGRETGTIYAAGDLTSGYLEAVHAAIGGDCHVPREITNCTIRVAGQIDAPGAAVRGGELSVARGGSVGNLGSIRGVPTRIMLAHMPDIEQKKRLAMDMLPKVNAQIEKLRHETIGFKNTLGKPNPAQTTRIEAMEAEIAALIAKQTKLRDAIDRLSQIIREHSDPRLTVMNMIYAKTEIFLPGYRAYFANDVKGELTITLDKQNQPVIERGSLIEPLKAIAKVNRDDRILPLPHVEEPATDGERQPDAA